MLTDPLTLLITILAAGAGALSTFVLARIDRVMLMRRIDAIQAQRDRDRKQMVFMMTLLGDIANKNGMGERFSTGILRVLSFTPTEQHDGYIDNDIQHERTAS